MRVQTARLTETFVNRLGLAKRGDTFVVRDKDIGGFHLRVSHKAKTFKLKLTVRSGGERVTRGFTLGDYPAVDADSARREAKRKIRLRDEGELPLEISKPLPVEAIGDAANDPFADIPNTKRKSYEAEADKDTDAYVAALAGARARNAAEPENLRLIDAWILFKEALRAQGRTKSTIGFYSDHMKRHLNQWHSSPLRLISVTDVRGIHAKITDSGRKATANQVVITGGAIYTFALKGLRTPGLDPLTPWSGYRLMNEIKARQTGMASKSLAHWHSQIVKLSPVLRAANEFCIFSGLRLRNLVSLRCSQVSFEEKCLFIDSTKSGVDFKLPLSPPMIEILKRARDASRAIDEVRAETWVFASDRGESGHIADIKNPNAKIHAPLSSHALRHTIRGIFDEARIPATHSKILLNHTIPSDVHSEYLTLDSMFDQLRESQNLAGALIVKALSASPGQSEARHAA